MERVPNIGRKGLRVVGIALLVGTLGLGSALLGGAVESEHPGKSTLSNSNSSAVRVRVVALASPISEFGHVFLPATEKNVPVLTADQAVESMFNTTFWNRDSIGSITAIFGVMMPKEGRSFLDEPTKAWRLFLPDAPFKVPGPVGRFDPRCDAVQYINASTGKGLGAHSECSMAQTLANQDFLKASGNGPR